MPVASARRPSRPKPKGNGQPIRTRRSLANGRTVEGAWGQSRARVPSWGRRGRPRRARARFLSLLPAEGPPTWGDPGGEGGTARWPASHGAMHGAAPPFRANCPKCLARELSRQTASAGRRRIRVALVIGKNPNKRPPPGSMCSNTVTATRRSRIYDSGANQEAPPRLRVMV